MTHRKISLTLLAAVLAAGCTTSTTGSAGSAASALEADDGELGMTDEAPAFGIEADLDEAGLLAGDPAVPDPMADSPEAVAAREAPGVAHIPVAVLWGRLPTPDPSCAIGAVPPPPAPDGAAPSGPIPVGLDLAPHVWSGLVAVNRGALLIARPLAFEGDTDRILPRRDPRVVAFTAATLGDVDGLALVILDPAPGSEEPLTLTYVAARPDGSIDPSAPSRTVPVAALLGRPVEVGVGDHCNHIVATVAPPPSEGCEQGFFMGDWNRVDERHGVILGRVVSEGGELLGHMRGLYGTRLSGEQVFFAKFIDREGHFRGIFAGRYDAGHFEGRWMTRDGERGGLGGEYREGTPGPETSGHFIGRFGQPSCRVPGPMPAPEPMSAPEPPPGPV